MPLTRNKQLAMYFLLSTRSNYRARIEGIPTLGSGATPNPPTSANDLVNRFSSVPAPSGFSKADIQTLTNPMEKTDRLFVDPASPDGASMNNVTTDPVKIADALDIEYDPSDPDCPSVTEANALSAFLANAASS